MTRITRYRDLHVWQEAVALGSLLFDHSATFVRDERFSLTDQMRRSSRSVAANIAEAWAKRRYEAAFVAKLHDSIGEAMETQTWLEFAVRCGYLAAETVADLDDRYEKLIGKLVNMARHPEQWKV